MFAKNNQFKPFPMTMNKNISNNLTRIVKSYHVSNTIDQLKFIDVDPNRPEEIIRATYQPVKNNSGVPGKFLACNRYLNPF